MNLDDALAQLVGVKRCGSGWVARCPAHDDRSPSLSIRIGDAGRLLLKCFAGCDYAAITEAIGDPALQSRRFTPPESIAKANDLDRTELAHRLWRSSLPASGSLAQAYLRSRGISVDIPSTLRFYPALRHPTGRFFPAMIAAVQAVDGAIVAVHRTYLRPDGSGKASVEPAKLMLGPTAGSAVRFAKAAPKLAVAEGIETALSIVQACPTLAVWAALSTSGMRALLLPELVHEAILCIDADPAGEYAAEMAAARFASEGRRVRIARPAPGTDFNDVLRI